MTPKLFITPGRLAADSLRLARQVVDSGWGPTVLLCLWRGGTPIGVILHEFLELKGIRPAHHPLKVASYAAIGEQGEPRLEHAESVLASLRPKDRVLIVDDIFDTGRTIALVRRRVEARARHVAVATVYWKQVAGAASPGPDFFVRRTRRWIVFPHELVGLTPGEIRQKGAGVHRAVFGSGPDGRRSRRGLAARSSSRASRTAAPRPAPTS